MSDIPSIRWADLVRIVKAGRTEDLKSCQVVVDGVLVFTAIIPHGDFYSRDYAIIRAEYLGQTTNIAGGKDPDELIREMELASPDEKYPNLVKARAVRKSKRLAREIGNASIPVSVS